MEDQEYLSGLPLDLRTNLFAVSPALMEKFANNAEMFNLELVPREQRIIDDEWLEDSEKENCSPVKESMSTMKDARFGTKLTGEKELEVYSKGFVPKNTDSNTAWAVQNFEAWCEWRQNKNPEEPVPVNLLEANNAISLNKWLSLYLIETRRKDGREFPSSTLDCLLSGLYRHTRKLNPYAVNFMDEKDGAFVGLRGVRDNIARQRREEGIGASVKHAEAVSRDEEEKLWKSGLLSVDTPRGLANAVFFSNGKKLCLRGGHEHYNLKLSQFQFGYEEIEGNL